jgi:hypothetical protein
LFAEKLDGILEVWFWQSLDNLYRLAYESQRKMAWQGGEDVCCTQRFGRGSYWSMSLMAMFVRRDSAVKLN